MEDVTEIDMLVQPLSVIESDTPRLEKMIKSSHKNPMDYESCLPWENGVDRNLPPKIPEHSWFYGFDFFDELSADKKSEILWLENARDISMFITLEQALPVLYVGYINKYRDLDPNIHDYLMIFSKEEIIHTLCFKRYMRQAKLPYYSRAEDVSFWVNELPAMEPVLGILYTLIVEWAAELGAMYSTQHPMVDTLTCKLYRNHHSEEVRHISFGKMMVQSYLEGADEKRKSELCEAAENFALGFIDAYSYSPDIAQLASFTFLDDPDSEETIKMIVNSDNNIKLNKERFADIYRWLEKMKTL